jgi:anti-sigma regulatory factor (Ser/Thr protein kinase)
VPANLAMRLSNGEANLALVRALVLGFIAALGLDALEADDLDTSLAEAFKNAVWHAYDGAEGPVEIELEAADGAINATVRDEGIGIRPHLGEARAHHVGIGLPLIHVRARRVIYTNREAGGTDLRMEFEMPSARSLAGATLAESWPREHDKEEAVPRSSPDRQADEDIVALAIAPAAALVPAVLPPVLATLAVWAGLSVGVAAELEDLVRAASDCGQDALGAETLLVSAGSGERALLQLRLDGLDVASATRIETHARATPRADTRIELCAIAEVGTLTLQVRERA